MKIQESPRQKSRSRASRQGKTPSKGQPSSKQELELLKLILDSIYNGVLVTDPNGYIIYFNKPYGLFLGVNPE